MDAADCSDVPQEMQTVCELLQHFQVSTERGKGLPPPPDPSKLGLLWNYSCILPLEKAKMKVKLKEEKHVVVDEDQSQPFTPDYPTMWRFGVVLKW